MDEPAEDAGEARQRRQSTAEEREARVQALLAAALPSPGSARRSSGSWGEPRRSQGGGESRRSWVARLSEPAPRRPEPRLSASGAAGRRERRSSASSAARGDAAWDAPRESDDGGKAGGGGDEEQTAELPVALVEARAALAAERAALDAQQAAAAREAAAARADREALEADRAAFEAERQQVLEALARLQEAGRATSGEFAALEAERRAVAEAHDALASERAVFEAHAAQLSAVSAEAQRASEEAARLKQEAVAAAAAAAEDAAAAAELRAALAAERRAAEEARAEAEARVAQADARAAKAEALRRDVAESAQQLAAAWRALEAVQRGAAAPPAGGPASASGYASFPEPQGASPPAAQAAHAAAAAVMTALRPAGDARWRAGASPATSSSAAAPQQLQQQRPSTLLEDVRNSLRQLELERASRVATLQSQEALLTRLRSSAGAEPPSSAASSLHYSPAGAGARIPPMLPSPATPASQMSQQRPSPAASSAASSSMARIGRGGFDPLAARAAIAQPQRGLVTSPPRAPLAASPRRFAAVAEAGGDKPPGKGGRKKRLAEPTNALPALAPPSPASCDAPGLFPGLRPDGVGPMEREAGAAAAATGGLGLGSETSRLSADGGRREGRRNAPAAGTVAVCTGKHCRKEGAAELLAAFRKAAPAGVKVTECKCQGKCSKAPVADIAAPDGRTRHTRMHASEAAFVLSQSFRPPPHA